MGGGGSLRLLRLLLGAVRVSPVLLVVGHGRLPRIRSLHGHGARHEELVLLLVNNTAVGVSVCLLLLDATDHSRINRNVALTLLGVKCWPVSESTPRHHPLNGSFGQSLPGGVEPEIRLVHQLVVEC